ncbi:MAG: MASE3 domain-containing protein, partial [bacterium]
MPSRKPLFSPAVRLIATGVLVIILTICIPIISRIVLHTEYAPERHALLEYFVAYIGICLLFICLRRFHLQRNRAFLFFGLGFLTFVVFQLCQNLAYPGFNDVAWIPTSIHAGIGFDVAARIVFSVYFLLGILNVNKLLPRPAFRKIILIYLSTLVFILIIIVYNFNFLPSVLFVNEQTTLFKKGLDGLAALVLFVAAILALRQFYKEARTMYFWFFVASIFGIFTSLYLGLGNTLFDVFYD